MLNVNYVDVQTMAMSFRVILNLNNFNGIVQQLLLLNVYFVDVWTPTSFRAQYLLQFNEYVGCFNGHIVALSFSI